MATVVAPREEHRSWNRSSPWWARRVPEANLSGEVCGKANCRSGGATPFDLYCEGSPPGAPDAERHLLLFADRPFVQHLVVNALRIVFGVLAFAAAAAGTEVPLYAAGALAGALVVAFPLRSFLVSRAVALTGFLAAVTFTALAERGILDATAARGLGFGAIVVALAALATAAVLFAGDVLVRDDIVSETDSVTQLTLRAIAGGLVGGLGLLVVIALYGRTFAEPFGAFDGRVSRFLLVAALASIGSGLALAAVIGLLRAGARFGGEAVKALIGVPRPIPRIRVPRPRPLSWKPRSRRDVFGQAMFAFARFFVAVTARLAAAVESALRWLLRALDVFATSTVRVINLVHRVIVQILRALWDATREMLGHLLLAVRGAIRAVLLCIRSLLLSVVLLGGAGAGAVYASSQFAQYLAQGGFTHAIVAMALAGGTALLLVGSWWSLTHRPLSVVREAARRLLWDSGPALFLVALALGWINGALGLAGVGSIRPGWLTYGGTALLVLGFLATRSSWMQAGRAAQ